MEFWLLTSEFPPFHGGGIATYSFVVAQLQSQNFDKVKVFTPVPGKKDKFEQMGNIEIYYFSVSKWSSVDLIGTEAALASSAKNYLDNQLICFENQKKPVVMEVTDWGGIGFFILEAHYFVDQLYNFPIVLSSHGPSTIMKKYNAQNGNSLRDLLLCKLELKSYIYADFIIFPSKYAQNKIVQLLPDLDLKKISVIKYPFLTSVETTEPKGQSIDVLYFGRKQFLKGFDVFLNVLKREFYKNLEIGVLGGEAWFFQEEKFGSELQKESGIDFIDFGLLQPKDVRKSLGKAKVVVLPSRVEWYSYAYLEAINSGAQVVISSDTGTEEVANFFSNTNTLIFQNGCPDDLNEKLVHAIASKNEFNPKKIRYAFDALNDIYNKSYSDLINTLMLEVNSSSRSGSDIKTTVVIPHHNLSKFLENTILSAQKANNVFIVVIDDGSNLDELVHCRELCHKYKVELIETSNQGLAATRNLGIDVSKTEYILFLDADDQIETQYIQESTHILDKFSDIGFVGGSVKLINESGRPKGIWRSWTPELPLNYYINSINSAGVVWRKSVLVKIRGFNSNFKFGFEDWDAINKALECGVKGALAPRARFIYRIRNKSMFQRMDLSVKEEMYSLIFRSIQDSRDKEAVANLIHEHGPGYLQISLANPLAREKINFISNLKNRFPFLLKVWKYIPIRIRNLIFRYISSSN